MLSCELNKNYKKTRNLHFYIMHSTYMHMYRLYLSVRLTCSQDKTLAKLLMFSLSEITDLKLIADGLH